MFEYCSFPVRQLLPVQLNTEANVHATLSDPTSELMLIHVGRVQVEPSPFISTWWAQHKKFGGAFIQLFGHQISISFGSKVKTILEVI